MRICQLTPCLWSGGAEERIARVLSGLDRAQFTLAWAGFGPVREALVERAGSGVQILPIPRNPTGGIELSVVSRIAWSLRRFRADVVHVHNWSTSLYGIAAARLAGVPSVIYESAGRESPAGPEPKRLAVMHTLAPHVTTFTTVCKFLGDEIVQNWGAPEASVRVMPTGVDVERIAKLPPREEVRDQLGLPRDARVVGAISVLRPVKRIPDLIEAVAAVMKMHPKVHLYVAGNALRIEPAELRGFAEAQGLRDRVHLPGRIEDPISILPAFDVFVNCSEFEGASNAIIEAMACGLPVVGTKVGGTTELFEDGVHGLLVPPRAPAALAAALDELLSSPTLSKKLGESGKQRARRRHTFQTMVDAYVELFESQRALVAGHPIRRGVRAVRGLTKGVMVAAHKRSERPASSGPAVDPEDNFQAWRLRARQPAH